MMKNINASIPNVIKNTKNNSGVEGTKIPYKNAMIAMQHNNLVEAKYSMTLQQKRIMIWLVAQIMPQDIDFKEHVLSIRELIKICGLSGESSYKEIRSITFSLIEKGIRIIDISDPNNKKEVQVSWLSSADYSHGQVKLSFSPKLKPYLLQLRERFTTVRALDLMQFKSIHAIRIYELLKQYEDIGERVLSIAKIKECCGVEGKLQKYSDFEKKIIFIAQREINSKSDIHFEFERIKPSRKITGIKFLISKNKTYNSQNASTIQTIETTRKPPLYYQLEEFGLSKRIINTLMKDNEEQTINNAIKCIEVQSTRTLVRNPKAMLLSAIKEQWHPDKYKLKQ
jgi:plasmid replication initiation protein